MVDTVQVFPLSVVFRPEEVASLIARVFPKEESAASRMIVVSVYSITISIRLTTGNYKRQLTVCCSSTLAGILLAFDSGTPALCLAGVSKKIVSWRLGLWIPRTYWLKESTQPLH